MSLKDKDPFRSSRPEVFSRKCVLKICRKCKGEHSSPSAISKKLHSNVIEITLRHACSPVNLLHIFRTPFFKNTYGGLFLSIDFFLEERMGNSGTKTSGPGTLLKFKSRTPGPSSKFKSRTPGPLTKFKSGTFIITFLHY